MTDPRIEAIRTNGVPMVELVWNHMSGRGGGYLYTVGEPSYTKGWRVWVQADAPMMSVGGAVVTTTAVSCEAAKAAAKADFARRIRSAIDPGFLATLEQIMRERDYKAEASKISQDEAAHYLKEMRAAEAERDRLKDLLREAAKMLADLSGLVLTAPEDMWGRSQPVYVGGEFVSWPVRDEWAGRSEQLATEITEALDA